MAYDGHRAAVNGKAAMARVMVVDDDAHIRELVRYFLSRTGFEVIEAVYGKDALTRLESQKVDCAILDFMMPRMDGWELCREIKEQYDFLVKSFETEELLARIRALLSRCKTEESQRLSIGGLVLDGAAHEVVVEGRPGMTFSRDSVIEDVWGMDFDGTARTVDVHINRLRDRFPTDRFGFQIIAIRGPGYGLEIVP